VELTDGNAVSGTKSLTITVNAAPTITTATLPGATVTGAYSQTLGSSGGTLPLSWSVTSGTLPSGLTLNSTSGSISGTVASNAVSETFGVTLSDANGVNSMTKSFTIAVNAAPTITTTTLSNAPKETGKGTYSYSASISSSGGTAPLSWSISSGSLPSGLSLNSSTGVISGTDSKSTTTEMFTVTLTDANGVTTSQVLTITVA
jgi:hypothetical protein